MQGKAQLAYIIGVDTANGTLQSTEYRQLTIRRERINPKHTSFYFISMCIILCVAYFTVFTFITVYIFLTYTIYYPVLPIS